MILAIEIMDSAPHISQGSRIVIGHPAGFADGVEVLGHFVQGQLDGQAALAGAADNGYGIGQGETHMVIHER
jgi:hypothetical protein